MCLMVCSLVGFRGEKLFVYLATAAKSDNARVCFLSSQAVVGIIGEKLMGGDQ